MRNHKAFAVLLLVLAVMLFSITACTTEGNHPQDNSEQESSELQSSELESSESESSELQSSEFFFVVIKKAYLLFIITVVDSLFTETTYVPSGR